MVSAPTPATSGSRRPLVTQRRVAGQQVAQPAAQTHIHLVVIERQTAGMICRRNPKNVVARRIQPLLGNQQLAGYTGDAGYRSGHMRPI